MMTWKMASSPVIPAIQENDLLLDVEYWNSPITINNVLNVMVVGTKDMPRVLRIADAAGFETTWFCHYDVAMCRINQDFTVTLQMYGADIVEI
jgi:hypothetical protein